ncbi:MAG: 6-carboxytetrahydropterin synthase QueD [Bacteroidales bacterium]|nr:6-carboxytetrahydropterin synthase QueD [Bacteroidales bacterium]
MAIIRLTKEFSFEMAHMLDHYDGLCSNMHGHSYRLFVTVAGEPDQNPQSPKQGMVMDFSILKKIVKEEIVDQLDHAMLISSTSEHAPLLRKMGGRIIEVDYQPTCENMVTRFAERIMKRLPQGVKLFSVKLHETATSFAEWYASDNI